MKDIHFAMFQWHEQPRPLVMRQSQAEFNFMQTSSDATWERLLATNSTENHYLQLYSLPVWLWLYCVNNWLICAYFYSFQRSLAETCGAKLMLERNFFVLLSKKHACLLTKWRFIFKTSRKLLKTSKIYNAHFCGSKNVSCFKCFFFLFLFFTGKFFLLALNIL